MNQQKYLVVVGIVVTAVLFLASSCTAPTNHQPIITSLEAEAEWTTPLSSLQVTCNASDPDGGELSYEWSTTGGDISGTGAVVSWTAPQEAGTYDVTVVVNDGQGGNNTSFVSLNVVPPNPPVIEKLCVAPEGHKYLRNSSTLDCDYCDYDVWITKEYNIECIVSDTSIELFYEWSCDDGEISGEGSTITWTAPDNMSVEVTVTVIVSDIADNRVSKNIVFWVSECTCGSWVLESGCK